MSAFTKAAVESAKAELGQISRQVNDITAKMRKIFDEKTIAERERNDLAFTINMLTKDEQRLRVQRDELLAKAQEAESNLRSALRADGESAQ